MIKSHPHICLFQPEIPQNAGTTGRLAAASGCRLHLVRPFGFSDDDKNLRRAGLDYWPFLDLEIHDDIDDLLELYAPKIAFLSKRATQPYTQIPTDTDLLVFGRETSGLPDYIWKAWGEFFYKIPMFHEGVRSINLANSVSIVVYDQLAKKTLLG